MEAPFGETEIAFTGPSKTELYAVSGVPSGLNTHRLEAGAPPIGLNEPPISIWPPGSSADALTCWPFALAFAPSENEGEMEPSTLRIATWFACTGAAAPFGCSVVKLPPIRMSPFESRSMTLTWAFASGSNPGSRVPSVSTRPI